MVISVNSCILCVQWYNNNIELEGGVNMAKVVLKENEMLDDALRRFKRQVSRNGTLQEARKREYYVKPGVRKKLKKEAARKARKGK